MLVHFDDGVDIAKEWVHQVQRYKQLGFFWDQSSKALEGTKGGQQSDLASEYLGRDPRYVQQLQGRGQSVTFVHSNNNNNKAIQSILASSTVGNSTWVSSFAAFAGPLNLQWILNRFAIFIRSFPTLCSGRH